MDLFCAAIFTQIYGNCIENFVTRLAGRPSCDGGVCYVRPMLDDVELGRRLAALRVYRGMGQADVAARAEELGISRGLGASQLSSIETGKTRRGIDGRAVMALAQIYEIDYGALLDPKTKIFAATEPGLVEGLIDQVNALTEQLERVSAQVASVRVKQGTTQRKEQRGPQAAPQST
jgi:transcriptional regulator with XRE-family HTH domain